MQQRAPAQRLAARQPVGERLGQQRRRRSGAPARPMPARAPPPSPPQSPARPANSSARSCARAPPACGRGRRGGGSGSARRRAAPRARAARPRVAPSSLISSRPRSASRRGDDPAQLDEHALRRAARERRGAARAAARSVSGSGSRPSSTATRTSRSTRSGSSANALGPAMRRRPAAQVGEAAERVDRLAARERLGDRVDGEVAQRQVGLERAAAQRLDVDLPGASRAPTTRQAPNSSESAKHAAPPAARGDRARRLAPGRRRRPRRGRASRAPARGRGSRRRRATPRGPPSASRAQPRSGVSHALARSTLADAVAVVDARHARRQPAGDLVVDRAQPPRDLLGGDPLARPARRSAPPARRAGARALGVGAEVDRHVVHAHRADQRAAARRRRARRRCSTARAASRRRSRSAARRARCRARRRSAARSRRSRPRGTASPRRRRSSARAPARGRARPGRRRTGPCRRSRCRSAPCRTARAGSRSTAALLAACTISSGRSRLAARRAQRAKRVELPREEAVVVELVGGREVRHQPDRLDAAALARRAPARAWPRSASRVPRRPMPESSLTCTRPPPAAATART